MSEQDFQDILSAIERVEKEITTPEQAQQVLRAEGYLDQKGNVSAPYVQAAR